MKQRVARRLRVGLVLVGAVVLTLATNAQELEPALDPAGSARLLIGPPAGTKLEGAKLESATDEVTSLMRCPVCQALSVADSPTPTAIAMRNEARTLLAAGYTEEQVLEYFERSYGEFIRLSPKAKGFNLVVWLLPFLALVVGGWLVARRMKQAGVVAGAADDEKPNAVEDLDRYAERVRREVAKTG